MATLSFNATGGDGYPRIDNKPGYVNTGFIDAEVLKEFVQKNSPLDASVYEPRGEVTGSNRAECRMAVRHLYPAYRSVRFVGL